MILKLFVLPKFWIDLIQQEVCSFIFTCLYTKSPLIPPPPIIFDDPKVICAAKVLLCLYVLAPHIVILETLSSDIHVHVVTVCALITFQSLKRSLKFGLDNIFFYIFLLLQETIKA